MTQTDSLRSPLPDPPGGRSAGSGGADSPPGPSLPAAIDSHTHLYFDRFDEDRPAVIARARASGFIHALNIGIDLETSERSIALAEEYPGFCFAAIGLHPNEANVSPSELSSIVETLAEWVATNEGAVRAIGEIGLDTYWDRTPIEAQERAFIAQLDLARRTGRPVVIHCREAWPRTLSIVEEEGTGVRGVFHCFGGTPDDARRALELGWYVSFAGNVSYPKAEGLRSAARAVPLDRILLETDAPFLAPQPKRGKRNEPAFALYTADTLAELHSVPRAQILAATTGNSRALFGLPPIGIAPGDPASP